MRAFRSASTTAHFSLNHFSLYRARLENKALHRCGVDEHVLEGSLQKLARVISLLVGLRPGGMQGYYGSVMVDVRRGSDSRSERSDLCTLNSPGTLALRVEVSLVALPRPQYFFAIVGSSTIAHSNFGFRKVHTAFLCR